MSANTCKSSFVMMIAKMLLLVSVSNSIRSLIEGESTGGVDNEERSNLAVNSAGHLQPSTHSSEVSLQHSLIKESKPAEPKKSALSNFSGSASSPATLRSLAPELAKNALRSVLGGYTPKVGEIPPELEAAKRFVDKVVQLRDSGGKAPLFGPPYRCALCGVPAWTTVNGMFMRMEEFMYETGVFLSLRTKFIDGQVRSAIHSGFKQIVYLGMGLDTRALRLREAGVHVVEVDKGEALFMKVQAVTGDESLYPAELIPVASVAEYVDALSGSVKDDKVLFVWESGSITSPVEVTEELLSKIFDRFPSAMVVFDSAESSMASSEFLGVVERAFGGANMYPGKFDITDMVAAVNEKLSEAVGEVAEVQVETVASTKYAEIAVPQYSTKFSSYFPSSKDEADFKNLFQHIRLNVMSKKQ